MSDQSWDSTTPSDSGQSGTHHFMRRVAVQLGLIEEAPDKDEVTALRQRLADLESRLAKAESRIADLEGRR